MLYRITTDLYFENETDAQEVFNGVKTKMSKAKKLIVDDPSINSERISYIEIHKCYHDEIPFKPCEIIERIEV